MPTNTLDVLAVVVQASAPLLTAGLAFLAWRTTRNSAHHQNDKVVLDALQSAIESAVDDAEYRKFLVDLRKEKLASLAFGIPVRPGDLGRLMKYYDQGFASTRDIHLAWDHRTASGQPLSFQLGRWERVSFYCSLLGGFFCALASALSTFLVATLAGPGAWKFSFYAGGYALLSMVTFYLFLRGQQVANGLGIRERRLSEQQRALLADRAPGESTTATDT